MNNLTDNEIMSAFKNCLFECDAETQRQICENCPYYKYEDCTELLVQDLFNLFNRQDAEIESLKAEVERLNTYLDVIGYSTDKIKAEAYKECIENIKEEYADLMKFGYADISVDGLFKKLDNLLNELVGEHNELDF